MNDDNDNVVLEILKTIQAELAKQGQKVDRLDETMNARFDGVEARVNDLDLKVFQVKMTLDSVREVAVKALSEVVSLSARVAKIEKRLEVIEAPKH